MISTLDFKISQEVTELFDLHADLHGIWVTLYDANEQLLYPKGKTGDTYCRKLRRTLGLNEECRKLDRHMMKTARQTRSMVSYICHAGMQEAVAPLFIGSQLAGFVMIGKFRNQSKSPKESPYAERWKKEQGNHELQDAFAESTILEDSKVKALLNIFEKTLKLICSGHLIRHQDYDLIAPVIDWIHLHPEKPLSLDKAATLSGRSPATVTRLFKKITGQSFKKYQTGTRLQRGAELLIDHANRPVSEVAAMVGFDDQFHFSRIFHKYIGLSPMDYRNSRLTEKKK